MRIVEDTLEEPIDDVLDLPLFCFLSTVSADGDPRVSPLWFLWEDERMWMLGDIEKTYTSRVQSHPTTAIAVMDFNAIDARVRHIGMRGESGLVEIDDGRVERKLTKYLGENSDAWDPMFSDIDPKRWKFIKFTPDTVVARDQSYMSSIGGGVN